MPTDTSDLKRKVQLEILLNEINNTKRENKIYKKTFANSHVYFPVENNLIEKTLVEKQLKKAAEQCRSQK